MLLSTILLQLFRHSIRFVSAEEGRILIVLFIIIITLVWVLLKYGNVIRKFREWEREKRRMPFEMLEPHKQAELLQNAYCLRCGQLNRLISPTDAINKGEHVVKGKCPKCGDVVEIRRD